ncbi:methyltransferase domain-containing protein [uncultured Sphingomonas sp.]|uniref:class I SAM-dependent methyltransferase n=1 Tax=uncultured Sphingomonas sp. TaxID=158754 RepID=UPI0025D3742B|nr:methyltransferase domain-containing protein [uncultured Sphingomonas sp.]
MKAIALSGFANKFAGSDDPWATFTSRDEAVKRAAILHALGPGPIGRVLELASGNGSNSQAIARRALRLDATEGTAEGTRLTARAVRDCPRARAIRLAVPSRLPRSRYDAVVVAELLYYLSADDMARVASDVAGVLRPGGRLVLAHHRIDFYDFAQHARGIQDRFLRLTGCRWRVRQVRACSRWSVIAARKLSGD